MVAGSNPVSPTGVFTGRCHIGSPRTALMPYRLGVCTATGTDTEASTSTVGHPTYRQFGTTGSSGTNGQDAVDCLDARAKSAADVLEFRTQPFGVVGRDLLKPHSPHPHGRHAQGGEVAAIAID